MSSPFSDRTVQWLYRGILNAGGAFTIALLLGIVVLLLVEVLGDGGVNPLRFVSDERWQPNAELWNAAPMIAASLAAAALALVIAGPLGLGVALFVRFYAPTVVGEAVRRALNVATAVPSVVYGLWGLVAVAPLLVRLQPPGVSLLAAALLLALMILPTFALLCDIAIGEVPRTHVVGAAALGASRPELISLVLRLAAPGLISAAALSFCRAVGETIVVVMLAGNIVAWPIEALGQVRSLAANIALEMPYAAGEHRRYLFLGALVLVGVVSLVTWLMGTSRGLDVTLGARAEDRP